MWCWATCFSCVEQSNWASSTHDAAKRSARGRCPGSQPNNDKHGLPAKGVDGSIEKTVSAEWDVAAGVVMYHEPRLQESITWEISHTVTPWLFGDSKQNSSQPQISTALQSSVDDSPQRARSADLLQIRKDVYRTFSDLPELQPFRGVMQGVLQEYAAADVEVGYCQGMSFVAAVTAHRFRSIDVAYPQFREIVSGIRGLWLPGLPLLLQGEAAFQGLCSSCLSDLLPRLGEQCVSPDLFLPDAWLTLFSRWLPFTMLWAVFEFVKVNGFPGVLAITVMVLKVHQSTLMAAADFRELLTLLKELRGQPRQPDAQDLVETARELVPSAHAALVEAQKQVPLASRSISGLSREGCRVVHHSSGSDLMDCHWGLVTCLTSTGAREAVLKGVDCLTEVIRPLTPLTPLSPRNLTRPSRRSLEMMSWGSQLMASGLRRAVSLCVGPAARE
mmetsp:Transcript_132279/g.257756  ORF Transcript_132279/g.257756 Transcript_132279/m.257756 type:complete len:445 (-) Transcript_132279:33-1367(-)